MKFANAKYSLVIAAFSGIAAMLALWQGARTASTVHLAIDREEIRDLLHRHQILEP